MKRRSSLKASNTFRSAFSAIAVGLLASTAYAIDPARAISQYVHDPWGIEKGFPQGAVYAFAQTTDGYLWVGTEAGLVRFDGSSFRLIKDDSHIFTIREVRGLASDNEGGLWLRLRDRSILRYRNGAFENPAADRESSHNVYVIARNREGEIILSQAVASPSRKGPRVLVPVVFRNDGFMKASEGDASLRSAVMSFAETPDGDFWMGTRESGLFRFVKRKVIDLRKGLPDLKVNYLLSGRGSDLWVGTDDGVVRWNGTELVTTGIPQALNHVQALSMTMDRDANIWIGTGMNGLIRINAGGVASLHLDQGVSHEAVTATFEDREGSLWIGGADGIERLGDGAFVTYSMPEGLPTDGSTPVYVDPTNRLWFPPEAGGLWWAKEGQHGKITRAGLDRDLVYSLAGANGELWIGRQRGGLTRLDIQGDSFAVKTYTKADGLAEDSVYSVYRARDGTVWAGTLSGGVSALRKGKFTNYTFAQGLASSTVASMIEDAGGRMWFATPSGLSSLANGRWASYGVQEGLPSENINCLLQDSSGVLWAGTASGLAFQAGIGFHVPASLPVELRAQILGLAEDRFGWFWIATSNHVLRVRRDKLSQGIWGDGDLRDYGAADGLRGTEGVKRHQSVIADSIGRIWFSLNRGISVVDPARLTRDSAPAIAHIQGLYASDGEIDPRQGVHLPAGRQRVTLTFAGLSFSAPDRVRYRYWLEHFDRNWSVPSSEEKASYTNLPPGSYRFHVTAANPDGVWSKDEATLDFTIDPLFWQSRWFIVLCGIAALLATIGADHVRLHFVTRKLNSQFEQRLAERIQVARDLHDTLLQTIQGSKMVADNVLAGDPDQARMRSALERLSGWLGRAIQEGRVALNSLRSSTTEQNDLAEALRRAGEECRMERAIEFDLFVEGKSWRMHPIVRDEIYRIAYEAIRNACTHSGGDRVVVKLTYGTNLTLNVRDNGTGIDPEVAARGKDGHFGVIGMYERAEKLRAKLAISSLKGSGAEVELVVPRKFALLSSKG
jgi:ligand-binding sensor domain-containing protein/signal transduction histidine kinase